MDAEYASLIAGMIERAKETKEKVMAQRKEVLLERQKILKRNFAVAKLSGNKVIINHIKKELEDLRSEIRKCDEPPIDYSGPIKAARKTKKVPKVTKYDKYTTKPDTSKIPNKFPCRFILPIQHIRFHCVAPFQWTRYPEDGPIWQKKAILTFKTKAEYILYHLAPRVSQKQYNISSKMISLMLKGCGIEVEPTWPAISNLQENYSKQFSQHFF